MNTICFTPSDSFPARITTRRIYILVSRVPALSRLGPAPTFRARLAPPALLPAACAEPTASPATTQQTPNTRAGETPNTRAGEGILYQPKEPQDADPPRDQVRRLFVAVALRPAAAIVDMAVQRTGRLRVAKRRDSRRQPPVQLGLTEESAKGGAQVVWIRNLGTTCCSQFDSNASSEVMNMRVDSRAAS